MASLDLFSLKGQNVLITGATRGASSLPITVTLAASPTGIGAACAIALAQAGADICLVVRPQPTDTPLPILAQLPRAQVVYADLSDMDDVKSVFQRALDIMGGEIHVLVNCAGIQRRAPAVDFGEHEWDEVSHSIIGRRHFFCVQFRLFRTFFASATIPLFWGAVPTLSYILVQRYCLAKFLVPFTSFFSSSSPHCISFQSFSFSPRSHCLPLLPSSPLPLRFILVA